MVEYKFEAAKRSAISRAYYGSFNVARRQLEEHGIPIENRRAHDQVWRTFRVRDRATFNTKEKWRTVGELGGALRALRNQADYADQVRMLDKQAVDAVDSAERIMVLLDELEFVD
ncbi:MAG TPA: hypothetical protein VGH14_08065 [Solirubrobacterales bacterium]